MPPTNPKHPLSPSLTHQYRRHLLPLMLQRKVFPHIIPSRRLISAVRALDRLASLVHGPDMPPQVHACVFAGVRFLAVRVVAVRF
jgi:hypothetical protein